jgi:hypothetical protein
LALEQLRAFRERRSQEELGPVRLLEPDGYPLLESSELAAEHERLAPIIVGMNDHRGGDPNHDPRVVPLLEGDTEARTRAYLALIERIFAYDAKLSTAGGQYAFSGFFDYGPAANVMTALFDAGVSNAEVLRPTLEWFQMYRFVYYGAEPVSRVVGKLKSDAIDAELRRLLIGIHGQCTDLGGYTELGAELAKKIATLLGSGVWQVLAPVETWSREQVQLVTDSPEEEAWLALLRHCAKATSARPSAKWTKGGAQVLAAVGKNAFRKMLLHVLPLVDAGRLHPLVGPSWENNDERMRMHEGNATILRGIAWLAPEVGDGDVTRAIGKLAGSAFKKVRGIGPRAPKVGNACVYALSRLQSSDAIGQLALLRARVRTVSAQKELDKAFAATAEALALPQDQIEEMAVPTYGLEEVGVRRESFDDGKATATAELVVDGTQAKLGWFDAKGKAQKSVPAFVKKDHKDELKELQAALKDIALMLPAQSERIDGLFLAQKRWPFALWRERYLDHPLVGTLARRLLWVFSRGAEEKRAGVFVDGRLLDVADEPIELDPALEVELWHPIGHPTNDVLAWRATLERHGIRQPFKQAHREIYLLTDAERTTAVYSNRFAAHVLRQHQLNALANARGWRNKLRMMVDDSYPPATRELPAWGLRAEFWIEGIGTDYGTDTNESGAYLRVATDQVRFYRTGAAHNSAHAGGGGYTSEAHGPGNDDQNQPLSLDRVPALVLSEIMRDVDLFVGVASVGNDPSWQDGGPEGRFRQYWESYAFGDLGESAKTRRQVLERLLPRLKIAERTSLQDRFLVVRGDIRSYKIHLGSGNILMEPNDQYLCIVPARGTAATSQDRLFLPFEGDGMLSVILSKAFLLAADKKISDPTIVRQIEG